MDTPDFKLEGASILGSYIACLVPLKYFCGGKATSALIINTEYENKI